MLFILFGIAITAAFLLGLSRGAPALRQRDYDKAVAWILGPPMLVAFACLIIVALMLSAD